MMSIRIGRRLVWQAAAGLAALSIAGCAPALPATGAAAEAPPPAGMARIWIYRNNEPYVTLQRPYVRFNGRIIGISEPGGAFYRDVPPGRYYITVDTEGEDVNQFPVVDVAPGQVVYAKVDAIKGWISSGGVRGGREPPTFYVRLQLPQLAQPEIAQMPFYGGGAG